MSNRLTKVRKAIKKLNLDALFITSQPNVTYLTRFSGLAPNEREAFLFITGKNAYLLTFPTYFGLYKKAGNGITTLCITSDKKLTNHLTEIIQKEKIKTTGFEEKNLTVSELKSLKSKVKTCLNKPIKWQQTNSLIENLRIIKDADELRYIRKAVKITDQAFDFITKKIKKGVSEKQLALEIEFFIKRHADDIAFSPIVAFDKNAAIPHYMPSNNPQLITHNLVLLDFGAKVNGYCSDMTRVVFFGSPKPSQIKMYSTVLQAQKKALKKLKAGVKGNEIDKISRNYIVSKGFPEYLHGLGHGVGLTIHEEPRMKKDNKQILPENSVVTLEPAIYLEGKYGIRIEDLVVLKKDGVEVLSKTTKDIIIIND